MAAQIEGVLSQHLKTKIEECKILVVGAGGIGCEILKNLVLSGFNNIDIIDLDTIEVSNLNRQFLFRKEHVGTSKAKTARLSALTFNPNVNITAYHDSIFASSFGLSFYKQFNLVLNALDNRAARNHVNRMCLNAEVPLIESGTAGYNGQVELISKGRTQCYECTPKDAQKTYPGCTIRNTPSEAIHCIVWAKHLFNQLFGEYDPDEEVSPDTADPEAAGDAGASALSSGANEQGNIERVSTRKWAESNDYNPELIFNKLFHDDIKYLLSMENLWKTRTAPQPIQWDSYENDATSTAGSRDQVVWTVRQCAEALASSIAAIKVSLRALPDGDHLVWDKDDNAGMDFVAACANIRSYVFGIPPKSRFDIKAMAGNIIPAIATTNAITAGLVVMRAFTVLQEQYDRCQSVYVRLVLNPRKQLLVPDAALQPPNAKCIVCSDKPTAVLQIDTSKVTVKAFHDDVLVKALNMLNADVIEESKGVVLISSEEGETDCNNDKLLSDLGIVDGSVLKLDDFFQSYELTLIVYHRSAERNDAALFEIIADPSVLKAADEEAAAADLETTTKDAVAQLTSSVVAQAITDDDDDDVCFVDDADDAEAAADQVAESAPKASLPKKRKGRDDAPESDDAEPLSKKRAKIVEQNSDDDLILIDDD